MLNLKILPCTHPDLKKGTSTYVFDENTGEHAIKPLVQMLYHLNVWGVAAPELGMLARIFVMDLSKTRDQVQCFINPEIVEKHELIHSEEDSLSIPNAAVSVARYKRISLRYQDELGETQTLSLEGMPAILAQQKIDFLNGITLLDHLSKLKRERLLKKMQKNPQACGHGCGHDHHHHHH